MAEGSSAGSAFFAAALGAAIAVGVGGFVIYDMTGTQSTQFETKLATIEGKLDQTSAAIDAKLDKTSAAIDAKFAKANAAIDSKLDKTIAESKKAGTGPSDGLKASALDGMTATLAQVNGRIDKLTTSVAGLERAMSASAKASNDDRSQEKTQEKAHDMAFQKIEGEVTGLKAALTAQKQTLESIAKSVAESAKSSEKPMSVADKSATVKEDRELIVVYVPQTAAKTAETTGSVTPAPLSVQFAKIGAVNPQGQMDTIAANLKKMVKDKHGCTISVAGYADTLGGDKVNLDISRERADAVAAKLRSAFAGQDVKIEKVGWGERQLKVWTPDDRGEKANRRVDISVDCKS